MAKPPPLPPVPPRAKAKKTEPTKPPPLPATARGKEAAQGKTFKIALLRPNGTYSEDELWIIADFRAGYTAKEVVRWYRQTNPEKLGKGVRVAVIED